METLTQLKETRSEQSFLNRLAGLGYLRNHPQSRKGKTAEEKLANFLSELEWLDFEFHQKPRGAFLNERMIEERLDEFYRWINSLARPGGNGDGKLKLDFSGVDEIQDLTWEGVQETMCEGD